MGDMTYILLIPPPTTINKVKHIPTVSIVIGKYATCLFSLVQNPTEVMIIV